VRGLARAYLPNAVCYIEIATVHLLYLDVIRVGLILFESGRGGGGVVPDSESGRGLIGIKTRESAGIMTLTARHCSALRPI
jgi:hypothetical protein